MPVSQDSTRRYDAPRWIAADTNTAGIVWDAVFSCEAIGFYKLRPQAYQRAAQWLQVDPEECMMVAAHPSDLVAAARVGYRTAFVRRPTEWGHGAAAVEAPDDFRPDITVDSFGELADELGAL